jgi:hypothetical protein
VVAVVMLAFTEVVVLVVKDNTEVAAVVV